MSIIIVLVSLIITFGLLALFLKWAVTLATKNQKVQIVDNRDTHEANVNVIRETTSEREPIRDNGSSLAVFYKVVGVLNIIGLIFSFVGCSEANKSDAQEFLMLGCLCFGSFLFCFSMAFFIEALADIRREQRTTVSCLVKLIRAYKID